MNVIRLIQGYEHLRLLSLSIISRILFIIAQFIATIIVIKTQTVDEQSIYFVCLSVLSIQFIFELGVTQILIINVSKTLRQRKGNEIHDYHLVQIAHHFFIKYLKLSSTFFISALSIGIAIFCYKQQDMQHFDWLFPWISLVSVYTLRFFLMYIEAIVEGCGRLHSVLKARSISQMMWILVFALISTTAGPMLSLTAATASTLLIALFWYRSIVADIKPLQYFGKSPQKASDISGDLISNTFSRNVSISWIASFLITNLPIIIVFALSPSEISAKLGVINQITSVLGVLSASVVTPLLSKASRLSSAGDHIEVMNTYRRGVFVGSIVSVSFAIIAVFGVDIAIYFAPITLSTRFPSSFELWPFMYSSLLFSLMSAIAVFYRSIEKEIFVKPLIVCAAIFPLCYSTVVFGNGITGLGLTIAFLSTAIIGTGIVRSFRAFENNLKHYIDNKDHIVT